MTADHRIEDSDLFCKTVDAALAAAEKGHTVSLYEKNDRLGGQLYLAGAPPGRAEFKELARDLQHQTALSAIRVVLRQTVEEALVKKEKPDIVILATGALPVWDSTRGILPDFPWKADDSADDPWDDILPERVRVVLTVFPTFGMRAYLMEDAPAEATILKVDTTEGFPPAGNDLESFVLVDSEWMRIVQVTGDSFTVERGARGTSPAAHSSGAEVRAGYSFMKVVYIPCHGKAVR